MPQRPEELRRRIDELVGRCDELAPPPDQSGDGAPHTPREYSTSITEMVRLLLSSLQTIGSACGKKSPHLRQLKQCRREFERSRSLSVDHLKGVLLAARDDLDAGMLLEMRQLVAAEAFGDLLASAMHLLEEGYHIPAVAVAGAVLESSLQTLAEAKGVSFKPRCGIHELNKKLNSASVYDKVIYYDIESWRTLRNRVDHGDFKHPDEVDPESARRMLDGLQHFVSIYR